MLQAITFSSLISGKRTSDAPIRWALARWVGLCSLLLMQPCLLTAQQGQALSFSGATDYVLGVNPNLPQGNSARTMEAWVNPGTVSGGIISWGTGTDRTNRTTIFLLSNRVYFSGIGNDVYGSIVIPSGTWAHVAVTYDGATVKIYVNGVLDQSRTYTNPINTIGTSYYVGCVTPGFWDGSGGMDELRVWNRALSQCEIQNNMNYEIQGTTTNLIANFHFNQGVAGGNNAAVTSLIDDAGNGNGVLNNFDLTGTASNWISSPVVANGNPISNVGEIAISSGGAAIADGSTLAQNGANTFIGNANVGGAAARIYTISNVGFGSLNIASIGFSGVDASMFSVATSSPLPAAVQNCAPLTVTVTFSPTSLGLKNATITINNDDANEAAYDFEIQGNGAVVRNGLDFDGSNDNVTIPHSGNLNLTTATLEAWVKWDGTQGFKNIFMKGSYGWGFAIDGGRIEWWQQYAGGTGPKSTNRVPVGVWTHVAVAVTNGGDISFYINGLLSNTMSGALLVNNGGDLKLGVQGTTCFCNFFRGSMDEVRVWNSIRTQSEIQANMFSDVAQHPNLVAYYRLDEGVAGGNNAGLNRAADYSGNGVCGRLENFNLNGATSNWSAGQVAFANTITGQDVSVSGNGLTIALGDLTPSTTDNSDLESAYVGASVSKTITVVNGGDIPLVVTNITLGGADASFFGINNFTFPVTVVPCIPLEIVVRFTPATLGLKSATLTVFSNDTDEPVYDFAIRGNGNLNKGLSFDYSDDFMDVGNILPTSYTKEAWVKLNNNGNMNIISGRDASGQHAFWVVDGKLTSGHNNNYYGSGGVQDAASMSVGPWYHVAVTYDLATTTMKLYKNGVLVSTNSSVPAPINGNYLQVGAYNDYTTLGGTIDEVRIWNSVRTASELSANMNNELLGNEAGLVAYYTFNQNTPDGNNPGLVCVADKTANNYSGTLNRFALSGATSNWSSGAPLGPNTPVTAPEVNLQGNAVDIIDGNTTTTIADNTDMGAITSGTMVSKSFVIQNAGADDLYVSGINFTGVDASLFSASGLTFPVTVTPNSNATFSVTFAPVVDGQRFATMNILNNDCNEALYNVALYGIGGCPIITAFPQDTVNGTTSSADCMGMVTYEVRAVAIPAATFSYAFSGATTGTGTGNGSAEMFNKGLTNVTVTASSTCGVPSTCTFAVSITDNVVPTAVCQSTEVSLTNGSATVTGAQLNNGSSDNCGTLNYECFIGSPLAGINVLNGIHSGGRARVLQFAASGTAGLYSSLGGNCNSSYQPEGSLCDEAPNLNSQTISSKSNSASGATWSSGGANGVGILVVDMAQAQSIAKLLVFQMFADGKVSHFRAYSHPDTSATAPLFSSNAWVPLFAEGVVGPGANSGNNVSLPTEFVFNSTTTRYLKFEVRNDGRHGNGSYIELRNVKAFAADRVPCTFSTADAGTSVPVQFQATDASGNQSSCNTSVFVAYADQEIVVSGNSTNIVDGNTNTSTADFTDMGFASVGNATTSVFAVRNLGNADLILTGASFTGPQASEFSALGTFPVTIAPLTTYNVTVQYTPTTNGAASATIALATNDADEASFDFALSAVSCIAPDYTATWSLVQADITTSGCAQVLNYTAPTANELPNGTVTYLFAGATNGFGFGTGSGTSFNAGLTNVTIGVANGCGADTTSFAILVSDVTAPVANCQAVTLTLSGGVGTVSGLQLNNGSTDNCSVTNYNCTRDNGQPCNFDNNDAGTNVTVTLVATDASGNTATCQSTVTVIDPNGFETLTIEGFDFELRPSIATEETNVLIQTKQVMDVQLTLTDINGKLIRKINLNQIQNGTFVNLDTKDLSAGLYLVSISNQDGVVTKKLVVAK